jgi:hypothetical protein
MIQLHLNKCNLVYVKYLEIAVILKKGLEIESLFNWFIKSPEYLRKYYIAFKSELSLACNASGKINKLYRTE